MGGTAVERPSATEMEVVEDPGCSAAHPWGAAVDPASVVNLDASHWALVAGGGSSVPATTSLFCDRQAAPQTANYAPKVISSSLLKRQVRPKLGSTASLLLLGLGGCPTAHRSLTPATGLRS